MTTQLAQADQSTRAVVQTGEDVDSYSAGWIAEPSRPRFPWVRLLSFVFVVAGTTAVTGIYLAGFAVDQYVSEFRFTVEQQTPLAKTGTATSASPSANPAQMLVAVHDAQIALGYLKSQQIVTDISKTMNMSAIWGIPASDPWWRLDPGASHEQQLRYWKRVVDANFDLTSAVVTVKVHAFTREDAEKVASRVLGLTEKVVNDLSDRSHHDALAFAQGEVAKAEAQLKAADKAMGNYRNAHAVLFPLTQATTESTVQGKVQEDIIDARTLLAQIGSNSTSPQAQILRNRIAAMKTQLAESRGAMANSSAASDSHETLASVMSGYEALETDQRIAEKAYEHALDALTEAEEQATEQLVYLDAFVRPNLPDESTYPNRWEMLAEVALGSFIAWLIGLLITYAVREKLT